MTFVVKDVDQDLDLFNLNANLNLKVLRKKIQVPIFSA